MPRDQQEAVPVPVDERNPKGQFTRQPRDRTPTGKRKRVGPFEGATQSKQKRSAKDSETAKKKSDLQRPSDNGHEVVKVTSASVGPSAKTNVAHRRASPRGVPTDGGLPREHTRIRNKVRLKGFGALDKRMPSVRAMLKWKAQVIADAGGLGALSTAGLTLIELTARSLVVLEHFDYHLFSQAKMVRGSGKSLKGVPLAAERSKLSESIGRQLSQLGLTKKATTIPALAHYVAQKYSSSDAEPAEPSESD